MKWLLLGPGVSEGAGTLGPRSSLKIPRNGDREPKLDQCTKTLHEHPQNPANLNLQ